jgi:uncharacterized protein (DUF1697 family)
MTTSRSNGRKDPIALSSSDQERELFTRFSREANGFSKDAVVGAAVNLLLNAMRQSCQTRNKAEAAFDDLFGRAKSILVDHYGSLGRKRGIFPYDQTIVVNHFDARFVKK